MHNFGKQNSVNASLKNSRQKCQVVNLQKEKRDNETRGFNSYGWQATPIIFIAFWTHTRTQRNEHSPHHATCVYSMSHHIALWHTPHGIVTHTTLHCDTHHIALWHTHCIVTHTTLHCDTHHIALWHTPHCIVTHTTLRCDTHHTALWHTTLHCDTHHIALWHTHIALWHKPHCTVTHTTLHCDTHHIAVWHTPHSAFSYDANDSQRKTRNVASFIFRVLQRAKHVFGTTNLPIWRRL